MARTGFGTDSGLNLRMGITMAGLGLLYVVIAAVLFSLGFNAVFVLLLSGGMLLGQWWFSDSLAMRAMRAVVVTPEQAPQLHGLVDDLCSRAAMAKPRIGIADTDVPNAFATGRSSKRAVVVVTTGLLRRLDRDELEGVLAHELSHVAHRDVTVMTIASFSAILAGFMARSAMWGSFARDRRDQNAGLVFLVVLLVSFVVYIVSFLLIRALSRYRELGADRSGALLTRRPTALARALRKIASDTDRLPTSEIRRTEPVSAIAFVPALLRGRGMSLESLFATHPPLERRLAQLQRIAGEVGDTGSF